MRPKINIVTVVYQEEIGALKNQARSIDLFFNHEDIDRIYVIINDRDQLACSEKVAGMVPRYGTLQEKVRIIEPDNILGKLDFKRNLPLLTLKQFFVHHRNMLPIRSQNGWRGNNGWLMQQAFKLCAARLVPRDFVLILDSKNFFVRPVDCYDFVSEMNLARSFFSTPSKAQRRWIENSFDIFGIKPPNSGEPTPPSTTPFCIRVDILKGCLNEIERRLGPIEVYFGYKPLWVKSGYKASEFMLIYAYVTYLFGDWKSVFDKGLLPASGINTRMDDSTVDYMISLVEENKRCIFSIHKTRVHSLRGEHLERVRRIFDDRGLFFDDVFCNCTHPS